jgi:hypothetical protein
MRQAAVLALMFAAGALTAPEAPARSAGRLEAVVASAGWSLKPLPSNIFSVAAVRGSADSRQELNRFSSRASAATEGAGTMRSLLQAETFSFAGLGGNFGLRNGDSDVCMSPPRNATGGGDDNAGKAAAVTDPCSFAPGEERWEPSCSDDYFGGSPRCCFSAGGNGTCSLCKDRGQCQSRAAVQCAARWVLPAQQLCVPSVHDAFNFCHCK